MPQIADACHVSHEMIEHMVESGKFMGVANDLSHPCKMCGTMILMGEYCVPCSIKMKNDLQGAKEQIKENLRHQTQLLHERKVHAGRSHLRSLLDENV